MHDTYGSGVKINTIASAACTHQMAPSTSGLFVYDGAGWLETHFIFDNHQWHRRHCCNGNIPRCTRCELICFPALHGLSTGVCRRSQCGHDLRHVANPSATGFLANDLKPHISSFVGFDGFVWIMPSFHLSRSLACGRRPARSAVQWCAIASHDHVR